MRDTTSGKGRLAAEASSPRASRDLPVPGEPCQAARKQYVRRAQGEGRDRDLRGEVLYFALSLDEGVLRNPEDSADTYRSGRRTPLDPSNR